MHSKEIVINALSSSVFPQVFNVQFFNTNFHKYLKSNPINCRRSFKLFRGLPYVAIPKDVNFFYNNKKITKEDKTNNFSLKYA